MSESECPYCKGWPGEADGSCPACVYALHAEKQAEIERDQALDDLTAMRARTVEALSMVRASNKPYDAALVTRMLNKILGSEHFGNEVDDDKC